MNSEARRETSQVKLSMPTGQVHPIDKLYIQNSQNRKLPIQTGIQHQYGADREIEEVGNREHVDKKLISLDMTNIFGRIPTAIQMGLNMSV
jgi:hypothetical protein